MHNRNTTKQYQGILERLRQRFASRFREEECGHGSKEGEQAKDEGGEDGGDFCEVDDDGREEDGNSTDNLTEGDSFSTDDCWEDLAAVLEADEEGSIGSHSANQRDGEADQGKVHWDEAKDQTADSRDDEEGEEDPAAAHLGNDKGDGPARYLTEGAKEVTHVDVSLPHIAGVLNHAIVAEESRHAERIKL